MRKRKIYQVKLSKLPVREIGMRTDRWEALELSISLIGVMVPIIIDKQFRIWDGVHRVFMSRRVGLKTIPAVIINSDCYDSTDLERLIEQVKVEALDRFNGETGK